jgi:HlyD family secretion protein
MRKHLRILGYILLAAALLAGGLLLRQRLLGPPQGLEQRVRSMTVSKGPITAKITATGTLSALVTVQVGSQVSGRIAELSADFNSQVKKGQVIARIDPQLFLAAVEQAKANLLVNEGNLAKARAQSVDSDRQLERQRALAQRQLIAQADLDTAQATAEANRAGVQSALGSVEQARANLHQAQINLAYTTIVSPIDGVVISRSVDVGQTVAASLQAPTLFTIAEDLTRMQVDTNVAEADIGKLKPDMTATFLVDAWPQVAFKGTIRQIRNAPINVQNVVTYDAVIDVENPDLKLKPGMTANVTVVWSQADEAVRVPNAALRFRPGADLPVTTPAAATATNVSRGKRSDARSAGKLVYVLRSGQLDPVQVQTGITDGTETEIVAGALKEGDRVVTESAAEGSKSPAVSSPVAPQQSLGGSMRRVL